MCDVLNVSESGFAAWRAGSTTKRRLSTPQLEAFIRAIHAEFDGALVTGTHRKPVQTSHYARLHRGCD